MYHKMFCKLDVDSNLERIEFDPIISESSKNVTVLKSLLKLNKSVLKYSRQNHLSNSCYKAEDSNQYNIKDQNSKYDNVSEDQNNTQNKATENSNLLILSTEVKNNQNYRDLFKYLLLQYKYLVSLSTQSKSFINKKLNKSRIIQKYKKYQNLLKQLSNYENSLQEIIISIINEINTTTGSNISKSNNCLGEEENYIQDELFLSKLKNCSFFNQSLLSNVSCYSKSISNTSDNSVKNGMNNSKYVPLYEYLKDDKIDVVTVYKKCNKLSTITLNEVKNRQKYNNYINLLIKCYNMKNELIKSINQFNRDVVNFKAYYLDNVNNVNYDIVDRVNKFHYSKYNIYYFLMSQIPNSSPSNPINIETIDTINPFNSDVVHSEVVGGNGEPDKNTHVDAEKTISEPLSATSFTDLASTVVGSDPSTCPLNTVNTPEETTTSSVYSLGTTKTDTQNEDVVESCKTSDNNIEITEQYGKENNRIVLRELNSKLCKKLTKTIMDTLTDANEYSNDYLSYARSMVEFTSRSVEPSADKFDNKGDEIKKYIGDNINHILRTISSLTPDNTVSPDSQIQTFTSRLTPLRSKQFESFDDNILLYINNMYIISLLYGLNYYTNVSSVSASHEVSSRKLSQENVESCDGKMAEEYLSHVIIKSDKYVCVHTGSSELIIPNDKLEDYVMARLKLSGLIVHKVSCVLLGPVQTPGTLYITRNKLGFHSQFQRKFFLNKRQFHTIRFADITDLNIDYNKIYIHTDSSKTGSLCSNTKSYTFMILDANIETIMQYINHYKHNSLNGNLRLNSTICSDYILNYIVNNYKILYSPKTLVYNCNVNMDLFEFYNLVLNHNNESSFVSRSKEVLGFKECKPCVNSFINPAAIIKSIKSAQLSSSFDNLKSQNDNSPNINSDTFGNFGNFGSSSNLGNLDNSVENEDNFLTVKLKNGEIMKGLYTKSEMNYNIKNINSKFFNKKITTCENLCYVFLNDVTIYQSVTTISNSPFSKYFYTVYTIIATSMHPNDFPFDAFNSLISNYRSNQTTSNPIENQKNLNELIVEKSKELDRHINKDYREDELRMENEKQDQKLNETLDEDCNSTKDNIGKSDEESEHKKVGKQFENSSRSPRSELNVKIYADVVFNKKIVFEKMIRNEAKARMVQATEIISKELNKYKVSHSAQNTKLSNLEANNQNKLILFFLLIIFICYMNIYYYTLCILYISSEMILSGLFFISFFNTFVELVIVNLEQIKENPANRPFISVHLN
ncbi:uncharacterized protein TA02900 [Theileria annulata]|uniref:GRAM domain containing protein n=1 Tax=Theileria annulata TaxID=5874 RepID=Q4UHJ4_THEAN|nr:uncharacterized protein TA02900 [Theileria annulata]CAI73445.1 hypothetical protein TA02900 [Theileria annulata]|eukprot:XP_954122.1 hypothetical protein TA02900 [Theileria annulata]